MTTLERWIGQACDALGLQVDLAYVVKFDNGDEMNAVARIRSLGARNGMLIVRSYGDVHPYAEALARAGYGYSVLSEPSPDEAFDLESFKQMFADWGSSGCDMHSRRSAR